MYDTISFEQQWLTIKKHATGKKKKKLKKRGCAAIAPMEVMNMMCLR